MAIYTNVYPALKALDAPNAAALVAAAVQAAEWQPAMVAKFCKLIAADPVEVAGIVANSRNSSTPWFVQP